MTIALGISAFYHDSAAAIVRDGEIVAAAQEERFTRKKHDANFPVNALRYCVKEAGVAWSDIDFVTFYEKPFLKFERLLETYLAFAPKGFGSFRMAMPLWLKEKLFQKSLLIDLLRAEAPDVDWDHYLQTAPQARKVVRGMTLYASSADKAMHVSRRLAGGIPRAGDVPVGGPCLVTDVDAIDATALGSDILGLNHGSYAEKTSILNDVRQLVTTGLRPPRKRLAEIEDMPSGVSPPKWWRFAP